MERSKGACGAVIASGWNEMGQLGVATLSPSPGASSNKFMRVSKGSTVKIRQIAAGASHSAMVTDVGELLTFGSGSYGRLGHGDCETKALPTRVSFSLRVSTVACGRFHTGVVCSSGAVYLWGRNSSGQLGLEDLADRSTPERMRHIACGGAHTVCAADGKHILAFGSNARGQLGIGSEDVLSSLPLRVVFPGFDYLRVFSISCGRNHSMMTAARGLDGKGILFGWGCNKHGQVGIGPLDTSHCVRTPAQIRTMSVGDVLVPSVVTIACGQDHTLAITDGGAVHGIISENAEGQLGRAVIEKSDGFKPAQVKGALYYKQVVSCAAGSFHSVCLTAGGEVYTFGLNDYGQLGDGADGKKMTPYHVRGLLSGARISRIAAGGRHSILATSYQPMVTVRPSTYLADVSACVEDPLLGNFSELMTQKGLSQLKEFLAAWIESSDHSDITLAVADGESLPAYKALLRARCPHFQAMFSGPFKESVLSQIDLGPDVQREVLLSLIEYVYTDSVGERVCEHAVELMMLANQFGLERLRDICEVEIEPGVDASNVAWLYEVSSTHSADQLKEYCAYYIQSCCPAIKNTESFKLVSESTKAELCNLTNSATPAQHNLVVEDSWWCELY